MAYRFVHTADVHLDTPLKTLALRDPDVADLIGAATRQAFERCVDLCLDEKVDALMIAGDLFDGEGKSMKTAVFFGAQMRTLTAAGVRVFIIRGNHDAASAVAKRFSPPEGVHVFSGRGEAVAIEGRDVVVHGVSFAARKAPESLLPKYKPPVEGCANIGLMHTSLAGAEGHDDYAPCRVADLVAHGFDYWGLGHVHKRQVHADGPCVVVMPGNPQGRDINEAGAKSATLVTVEGPGQVRHEPRLTSVAQFERVRVDVGGAAVWSDVARALETALGAAREAATSDHLVARLEIAGDTPLAGVLRRDGDLLADEARAAAGAVGATWIERVDLAVRAPAPADGSAFDPLTELADLIEGDVMASAAFRDRARAMVAELQRQLPAEARAALGDTEADLDEITARLIREGGEEVVARLEDGEADER